MKPLKEYFKLPCALREVVAELEFSSSASMGYLLGMPMMVELVELKAYYSNVELIRAQLDLMWLKNTILKLHSLKDIRSTIKSLTRESALSDIELFELKSLLLINESIRKELEEANIQSIVTLNNLEAPLAILDPEGTRVNGFYIYDIYRTELPALRREFSKTQDIDLQIKIDKIEAEVRKELTRAVALYSTEILDSQTSLFELDIYIAKSKLQKRLGLTTPMLSSDGVTKLEGLFNPVVRSVVELRGEEYQSVDIEYWLDSTIIIGANMGGKTVTLRSIALCQLLCQFGFGAPASSAIVDLKSDIILYIGDGQSTESGYSSFASEVLAVDAIIKSADSGTRILALIDEPARTTNPTEGTALVEAIIQRLSNYKISLILTTHYTITNSISRRYRVLGLQCDGTMNYRFIPTTLHDIPQEAIAVAQSLGVDSKWIEIAKNHI